MNIRLSIFAFCVITLLVSCSSDCSLREEQIPVAPLYPESILIVEEWARDAPSYAIMAYTYSVNAEIDIVVDFFEEISGCRIENFANRVRCHGKADPFGVYDIYIDFDSDEGTTVYEIEVAWNKCGYHDPDINIEG